MTYEIEVVPVYRIRGDAKKFRTYKAVINRLAWKLVFDKYGTRFNSDYIDPWLPLKNDVYDPLPPHYECTCAANNVVDGEYCQPHVNCPVHDRESGYLKRLHDRLARFLLVAYPAPKHATMEVIS